MQFKKICVLGLGYIGLPTASTFATHGIEVVGVDVNRSVIETLRNGGLHIHEPGLRTLVSAALGSGKLRVSETPEPADAYIIAVPTPFTADKRADLNYVRNATEAILPFLSRGELIVLESTSPPGTTAGIVAQILERSGLKAGDDFHLAYSPERVLPGQILRELIDNARVIGGIQPCCAEMGRDLYKIFVRGDIILTDATTAEMVKLMENTYRDVNIAIANEFSRLADRFGIDVWETIQIANRHPRVDILRPGPGVGGHCISVDPWFLVEAAPDLTTLIQAARKVNDQQPQVIVELIQITLKEKGITLSESKIGVLGLTYKADIDDTRESPAIEICARLSRAGASVTAHDPYIGEYPGEDITNHRNLADAVADCDLVVLLVQHTPFKSLVPDDLKKMTRARLIVDAVNILDPGTWQQGGFQVRRLGVGN